MSADDLELVELLGSSGLSAGRLEERVRERFGISMAVAWQRVWRAVDTAECAAAVPLVTHRLRRIRDARRRSRSRARLTA